MNQFHLLSIFTFFLVHFVFSGLEIFQSENNQNLIISVFTSRLKFYGCILKKQDFNQLKKIDRLVKIKGKDQAKGNTGLTKKVKRKQFSDFKTFSLTKIPKMETLRIISVDHFFYSHFLNCKIVKEPYDSTIYAYPYITDLVKKRIKPKDSKKTNPHNLN